MNLRQAYDGWSQQSQNRQLYVKTREAFRKSWFTLPTNNPCSWYTKDVLALALAETRVVESDKVKSASVMVHVLTWANFAEPKWNPKPNFKTEDVTRLLHLPADELEKERQRITAAMQEHTGTVPTCDSDNDNTEGLSPACSIAPKGETSDDDADPLAGIDFDDKKQVADALMEQSARIMNDKPTNNNPKNETIMEEKKQGIQPPKAVVQMNADTLQPIKTWESVCQAERELHIKNITRAILKHSMAGGYYWCRPEDTEGFKPAKKHNGGRPSKAKQEQPAPDEVPASVVVSTPTPKFKAGDHVWAKNTKELAGRTGYVTAVDTYKMEYTVLMGTEAWIIPEKDLELVNETASSESVAKKAVDLCLTDYTDDELLEELDRRGWEGELSRRQVVTIGAK